LALVLALLVAGYLQARRPKPPAPPSAALLARHGCTLRLYADEGHRHLSGTADDYLVRYAQHVAKAVDGKVVTYGSFPPTSGPHMPRWVRWGTYAQPVSELEAVHNLEHGGIVVQVGRGVAPATLRRIRAWVAASPNGMLLAPLPALGSRVALTAWTALASCRGFDPAAFGAFRDVYRFKGPERFSPGDLAPGR
jgi:hypothetical protein